MNTTPNTTTGTTNVNVTQPTLVSPNPLISAAQSVRNGEMPPNTHIQETINQTQRALNEVNHDAPLSQKGQVLVEDARQLLDSASRMLQEKNSDEKFQRLLNTGVSASRETREGVSGTSLGVGRGDLLNAKQSGRGIWDNGRSLAMFAVKSGQFRDILLEVLDLFQNLIRTTQAHIAQQPDQGLSATNLANNLKNETFVGEDQKRALWDKFRVLLNQLGSRPEYYTAVDHIFMIVDQLEEKARFMRSQTPDVKENLPTWRYQQMWNDVKLAVEEFSGTGSMELFERRNLDLFNAMKDDPEAQSFFRDFRVFVLETVKNPLLLNDESRTGYGRTLMERGRLLFQGKYRPYFQDVFDQSRVILTNIKNDSCTQDFTSKLQKFGSDFAFDESGRPDLFVIQDSLSQMKSILVPILSKNLSNLPIPKIEGSNAKYDFSVEGLLLHVGDLLPEYFNIRTKTDTTMSVQKLGTTKNSTKIIMEVDRIKALFKDIRFFYRRKRMPKIEDHGVADVDISQGSGVSLQLVWKLKSSANAPYQVKLLKCKCNIDRLSITVRSAKHRILDKLATKLFAGTIKRQVANAIVNNIISTLNPMSARFNEFFKSRPLTGMKDRVNEGMKTTMFTGETEDKSLLQKAREGISTGIEKAREMKNTHANTTSTTPMTGFGTTPMTTTPMTTTPMTTTPMTTTPMTGLNSMETLNTSLPPSYNDATQMTFNERSRKGWNFEWYSPMESDVIEGVNTNTMDQKLEGTTKTEQKPLVSI